LWTGADTHPVISRAANVVWINGLFIECAILQSCKWVELSTLRVEYPLSFSGVIDLSAHNSPQINEVLQLR
jgi:hypothetical protein